MTLPTVVCGAFGQYVNRLHRDVESAPSQDLEAARSAMEMMATSKDPEVQNTLVVEVYEHLELSKAGLEEFRRSLGPVSRALYERWMDLSR